LYIENPLEHSFGIENFKSLFPADMNMIRPAIYYTQLYEAEKQYKGDVEYTAYKAIQSTSNFS
jgi:hypothetical protein